MLEILVQCQIFAQGSEFIAISGNIPWFFVSELFEHSARGKANTVAVLMNWFANFLIGVSFLPWKVRFYLVSRKLSTSGGQWSSLLNTMARLWGLTSKPGTKLQA